MRLVTPLLPFSDAIVGEITYDAALEASVVYTTATSERSIS
jgi:hypothetical protein